MQSAHVEHTSHGSSAGTSFAASRNPALWTNTVFGSRMASIHGMKYEVPMLSETSERRGGSVFDPCSCAHLTAPATACPVHLMRSRACR